MTLGLRVFGLWREPGVVSRVSWVAGERDRRGSGGQEVGCGGRPAGEGAQMNSGIAWRRAWESCRVTLCLSRHFSR